MTNIYPDIDWYTAISQQRQLSPRCPFANAFRCPRYYQSLALLGEKRAMTAIPEKEDKILLAKWMATDLWPLTKEQAAAISGSNWKSTHYSNFCPEVAFECFGLFAIMLCKYIDEIDKESAERWLVENGRSFSKDWRWSWAHVEPLHYGDCSLYSQLQHVTIEPKHQSKVTAKGDFLMPQQGLIFRVLVASPSDCVQERKAIPEIIYSWNATNSLRSSAIIEPVLWETHATPELGDRPQALINKQLVENCDIVVGVFWTRLGTSTGVAESGTAEEIEEFRKAGKPVLLYFSSAPVVPDSIDSEQYKALVEYKRKLQGQGLVFSYDSVGEFRQLLQRHISSTIGSLLQKNGDWSGPITEQNEPEQQIKMFKSQFESFLRRFEADWSAERDTKQSSVDDAKYMIDGVISQILDFKAQIIQDEGTQLSSVLQDVLKRLKALRKHRLFLDGGKSYRAFWQEGDEVIKLLKQVPLILEKSFSVQPGEEPMETMANQPQEPIR